MPAFRLRVFVVVATITPAFLPTLPTIRMTRFGVIGVPVFNPFSLKTLRFAISDTGIGVPPDKIDELFDPFTQVDTSSRRRYGGSGLGLAISKRLRLTIPGGSSARLRHHRFPLPPSRRRRKKWQAPQGERSAPKWSLPFLGSNAYHHSNGTFLLARNRGHFDWLTTTACGSLPHGERRGKLRVLALEVGPS